MNEEIHFLVTTRKLNMKVLKITSVQNDELTLEENLEPCVEDVFELVLSQPSLFGLNDGSDFGIVEVEKVLSSQEHDGEGWFLSEYVSSFGSMDVGGGLSKEDSLDRAKVGASRDAAISSFSMDIGK